MKPNLKASRRLRIAACLLLASANVAPSAVRYVDVNSANPTPPYTNWVTAAQVIQDAVDAASPGDEVVVTNGVYQIGGRAVYGLMTNRVAVDKPLTLRSVNGPQATIIRGYQVPGTTNGDGAIRCVYLTNGASLLGFTLTNGATRSSAGDLLFEQSGGGVMCNGIDAVVSNCVIAGNSATLEYFNQSGYSGGNGGGAFSGTLNNCTLTGNSAYEGGGACNSTLNDCIISGNCAADTGGGSYGWQDNILSRCALTGNMAVREGGGASGGVLSNCFLVGNSAGQGGGVAARATLSTVTQPSASSSRSWPNPAGIDPNRGIRTTALRWALEATRIDRAL
jgi:hypothetical protein